MADMPPAREECTLEDIEKEGKTGLFVAFERAYRQWLQEKVDKWPAIRAPLSKTISARTLSYIDQSLIPEIRAAPNFNRYKGHLERVCAAAHDLTAKYDVGMGIAKKGLWHSFVFNLHGLRTFDSLIVREGDFRLAFPLDPAFRKDFKGKKVLLFYNDVATGGTIKAAAKHLSSADPKSVDALLIYAVAEFQPGYFNQISPNFQRDTTVYGERNGAFVVDTSNEIKPYVRKVMALDRDYASKRGDLRVLAKKLGVHYEPKT
jgi:hypothetical protein